MGKLINKTHYLTLRETQVLNQVSRGLSNKRIARHLNIEEGTVKRHLHNIYEKLCVTNRIEAINAMSKIDIYSANVS